MSSHSFALFATQVRPTPPEGLSAIQILHVVNRSPLVNLCPNRLCRVPQCVRPCSPVSAPKLRAKEELMPPVLIVGHTAPDSSGHSLQDSEDEATTLKAGEDPYMYGPIERHARLPGGRAFEAEALQWRPHDGRSTMLWSMHPCAPRHYRLMD